MECVFCKKENIREVAADYSRNFKDKKVLIKNVPALYCEVCGDFYFKNSVIKTIKDFLVDKLDKPDDYLIFDYNDISLISMGN